MLGKGHRATLKPTIKHVGDASKGGTLLIGPLNAFKMLGVEVRQVVKVHSRTFGQLLHAPNTHHLSFVGNPHGDRGPVKAIPRHVPIARIGDPVMETFLSDMVGDPFHFLVDGDKPVPQLGDLDKETIHGSVDEGSAKASTVGVGMGAWLHPNGGSCRQTFLHYLGIGVFPSQSSKGPNIGRHDTILVDGAKKTFAP